MKSTKLVVKAAKRFEFFFLLIHRRNWNMFAVSINFLLPSSPLLRSRTSGPRTDWWNSSLNFLYLHNTHGGKIYSSQFDEINSFFWVGNLTRYLSSGQCSKIRSRSKCDENAKLDTPSKSEMCKFSSRVNCWWTIWIPQCRFAQKSQHKG